MKTSTLFTAREVTETELASVLEKQFSAAWFPEYHRCSIDTDDAFVSVDFDPAFVERLEPDERRSLAAILGFVPKVAFHVSTSSHHVGSPALAERVLDMLSQQLGGRTAIAA